MKSVPLPLRAGFVWCFAARGQAARYDIWMNAARHSSHLNRAVHNATIASLATILCIGCSQSTTWTPPPEKSVIGPPQIYERTPNGLVPLPLRHTTPNDAPRDHSEKSPEGRKGSEVGAASRHVANPPYTGTSGPLIAPRWAENGSEPVVTPDGLRPVTPQFYYVRGEHTADGYIRGHYRREGDYTRGEQTSSGLIRGHYRGDGEYTRGEHTSRGYIPGHYRAEPLPFGQTQGTSTSTSSQPPTFARPIGG